MSEKKPYDKIYLIGWHPEASFYEDVTWCQDQIGEDEECPDIEYVRADLFEALEKELGELRNHPEVKRERLLKEILDADN